MPKPHERPGKRYDPSTRPCVLSNAQQVEVVIPGVNKSGIACE